MALLARSPFVDHLRGSHVCFQEQKTAEALVGLALFSAGFRDVVSVRSFGV